MVIDGGRARARAEQAGRSSTARTLVLVGWAAKGIVYVALAWIVVQMAQGQSQQEADTTGALQYIGNSGAGGVALVVLGIGLLAYAVGRLLEVTTLAGSQIEKSDKIKAVVMAAIYASVAFTAFAIGDPVGNSPNGGGGGSTEQQWSTMLFDLPGGQVLVALLGLAIIALGAWEAYKGMAGRHMNTLRTSQMSPGVRSFVGRAGAVAYVTKGMIYALLGYFFVRSAVTYNPKQAKGLDAALHEVAQSTWGTWLLTAVALGLLSYGLFCFIESRYRRVGVSPTGTA